MKINLNQKEYNFEFKFKQLVELEKVHGVQLEDVETFVKKLSNTSIIGALGLGMEVSEVNEILSGGSFEDIKAILSAFDSEVSRYINPNLQSQTN